MKRLVFVKSISRLELECHWSRILCAMKCSIILEGSSYSAFKKNRANSEIVLTGIHWIHMDKRIICDVGITTKSYILKDVLCIALPILYSEVKARVWPR